MHTASLQTRRAIVAEATRPRWTHIYVRDHFLAAGQLTQAQLCATLDGVRVAQVADDGESLFINVQEMEG